MAAYEVFFGVVLSPLERCFTRGQRLSHHFALIVMSTAFEGTENDAHESFINRYFVLHFSIVQFSEVNVPCYLCFMVSALA